MGSERREEKEHQEQERETKESTAEVDHGVVKRAKLLLEMKKKINSTLLYDDDDELIKVHILAIYAATVYFHVIAIIIKCYAQEDDHGLISVYDQINGL